MRFARIENNVVLDVVEANAVVNMQHLMAYATYVQIPTDLESQVVPGWTYLNNTWAVPVPVAPLAADLKKASKAAYENYISKYFTDKELIHMSLLLAQNKSRAVAVYAWIQQGITLATQYQAQVDFCQTPSNDYSSLGVPPYTYEVVIAE